MYYSSEVIFGLPHWTGCQVPSFFQTVDGCTLHMPGKPDSAYPPSASVGYSTCSFRAALSSIKNLLGIKKKSEGNSHQKSAFTKHRKSLTPSSTARGIGLNASSNPQKGGIRHWDSPDKLPRRKTWACFIGRIINYPNSWSTEFVSSKQTTGRKCFRYRLGKIVLVCSNTGGLNLCFKRVFYYLIWVSRSFLILCDVPWPQL